MAKWKFLNTISTFSTSWVTLIGERVLDENEYELDYWRIEKDDSVIIIPVQKNTLIVPKPIYRHGIGQETIDFPGGRRPKNTNLEKAAIEILERELAIKKQDILSLDAVSSKGWPVNSSFSNQLVYGFSATLKEDIDFETVSGLEKVKITEIHTLLERLHCLQCRGILLEWMFQNKNSFGR